MLKSFVLTFVFLFSVPSAAQVCQRQEDGTCYNDDIIGKDGIVPKIPLQPAIGNNQNPGIAVGEPNPNGGGHPQFPHKKKKRRRPLGGFVPIHCGADSRDVGCTVEIPHTIPLDLDVPHCNDSDDSPDSKCRSRGNR